MIDDRFAGKAVGIGSSDILGRIGDLSMRVGPLSYHNQVAILRESRVDLIIGLDFLRRFKAEINLDQRILKLRVRDKTIRMPFISTENSQLKTFTDAANSKDEVDEDYDYDQHPRINSASRTSSYKRDVDTRQESGSYNKPTYEMNRSDGKRDQQPAMRSRAMAPVSKSLSDSYDEDDEELDTSDRVTMEGI